MSESLPDLVAGYLDQTLSEAQEAELAARVKADPAAARAFAEAARMHDALRNAMRLTYPVELAPKGATGSGRAWRQTLVGVTGVAALAAVVIWWTLFSTVSAAAELERLIQAPSASIDRTYRIVSLDTAPEALKGRQAPLDGASLYVRAPDRYVLVRRFADGRTYVTGFDGERNWSAPPDGAVRLSHDPHRFQGPLPGHQHGIPFADLRSDLVELRDAYDLFTLPSRGGRMGILAERKSPERRGPKRVELWYDGATRVVHRIVFEGMPQARGGPQSLAVELVEQAPLPAEFFRHDSHHEPNRRVIDED